MTAPAQLAQTRAEAILWEIEAKDTLGGARDALKVRQRIVPAVPLTVQQATLVQLDGPFTLDVAPPADALPGRGGLKLSLQPRLAEGLTGVRDWFASYPYTCLEQKTSKSIGLRDAQGLAGGGRAAAELPGRRRPGQLLPAARRRGQPRQRHPDRVPAGGHARSRRARSGLRAARRGARADGTAA